MYWVEDIRAVFLEGPHNVPSADPTHLFDEDILSVSHREHLSHEEQGSLILVEFRPLIGVGNVFEAQGMEREPLPERFQTFHLVDAPDSYPGDGLIGRGRKYLEQRVLAFVAVSSGGVEGRDHDLVRSVLADRDKGAGGSHVFLDRFWASFIGSDLQAPCLYAGSPRGSRGPSRWSTTAVFPLCQSSKTCYSSSSTLRGRRHGTRNGHVGRSGQERRREGA
jgi:hypothetical protein